MIGICHIKQLTVFEWKKNPRNEKHEKLLKISVQFVRALFFSLFLAVDERMHLTLQLPKNLLSSEMQSIICSFKLYQLVVLRCDFSR